MSNDESRIESIFFRAVEIEDSDRRSAFLDEVCGDDPSTRRRVKRLLDARPKLSDFLERPIEENDATVDRIIREKPGDTIGNFKLLQEIGEGGFGVVFMAEQESPVRRQVALKIVKPGMDTREVVARFEAERQALALMQHPNIAQVYDGGATDNGRPYFVMELVKGVPITQYADKNKSSLQQRLTLFFDVCLAVQHAHRKGFIHRDIKPSNVMVTLHDGRPVVKVIDFGVSKAVNQRLTEKTLFTAYGQVVGTPQYMSPEQAEMSGLDVDTRSDVYSLGILLYELLTGTTPIDRHRLLDAGFAEMLRIIAEEDTPRPSVRLSTLGEQATVVAEDRSTDIRGLSDSLRGELDWIVMRALEKDRTRRYENASDFAADINRFMSHEPVEACPPSRLYRLRKFARRHYGKMLAAAALLTTLTLGLIGTSVGLVVATREAKLARIAEGEAIEAKDAANRSAASERQANEKLQRQLYVQYLNLAQQRASNGRHGATDEALESCPERLRNWEWWYLSGGGKPRFEMSIGTGSQNNWVAFSPDSRYLASTSGDEFADLWDMATGEHVRAFENDSTLWSLDISPDNSLLACGGTDGFVYLWDIATGARVSVIGTEELEPGCCARGVDFSPDGTKLAYGSHGTKLVRVWDISDPSKPQLELKLAGHKELVSDVEFSPDGTRIASSSNDETIKVWNLDGGDTLTLVGHESHVNSVVWTPNGQHIVSGSFDTTIRVWDARSGQPIRTLFGHGEPVIQVRVSPDGNRLASAEFRLVKIWDLEPDHEGDRELLTLPGGETVAFSRRQIASSKNGQESVIVWDGRPKPKLKGSLIRSMEGHQKAVMSVAYHPRDALLASSGMDHTVRLWDLETGRETTPAREAHLRLNSDVEFSPDGNLLAVCGRPYAFRVWDLETKEEFQIDGHPPTCIAFTSGGELARELSTEENKEVARFQNPRTGAETGITFHQPGNLSQGSIFSVAVSSNGQYLATSGTDASVRIFNVKSGHQVHHLKQHTEHVWDVCFSPDDSLLASSARDGTVRLWRPDTGELVRTLSNHYQTGFGVAFHPSGEFVASGSGSAKKGRVVIWNVLTGEEAMIIDGHTRQVTDIAFHPEGRQLATASMDKTVKIWDVSALAD